MQETIVQRNCKECEAVFMPKKENYVYCYVCSQKYFAAKDAGKPFGKTESAPAGNRDESIRRLALLKVSAMAKANATPEELTSYAKELEAEFLRW